MAYTLVPTELIVDGAITSAKLDTNIAISGTLGVTGEVTLATHLIMGDNDKIKIGTGGDLEIYHDGSNSYISNSTGNIYLGDTNGAVHIQAKLNEESIICAADGAVTLYHDNSPKLATTSTGIDVTGTATMDGLTVSDGTETTSIPTTADRLSFTGASLNYIQSAGSLFVQPTGDLVLNGSGAEIMRLKSGNVGIGTTNPDTKLEIEADDSTNNGLTNLLTLSHTTTGTAADGIGTRIVFNGEDDGGTKSTMGYIDTLFTDVSDGAEKSAIQFYTRSGGSIARQMHIDSTGVGIGTTSPAAVLEVEGSPVATGDTRYELILSEDNTASAGRGGGLAFARQGVIYGGIKTLQDTSSDSNASMYFQTVTGGSNTTKMTIDSSGNVGIGTSSPTQKLDVRGAIRFGTTISDVADGGRPLIYASDGTGSHTGHALVIQARDGAGSEIDFVTGTTPTTRMHISSSGKVGIGTSSPLDHLHINDDSGDARILLDGHTGYDAELKFAEAGVVKYSIGHDAATDSFVIGTTNVDTQKRLVIDSSGNVGIGTSSPVEKLDVQKSGDNIIQTTGVVSGGVTALKLRQSRGSLASPTNSASNGDGNYIVSQIYRSSAYNTNAWIGLVTDSATDNGRIVFGTASSGTVAEKMRIDSAGVISADGVYNTTSSDAANVRVLSNGNIVRSTSSRKYKNSITDASKGLTELNNLRPVTYKGNNDGETVFYGLIAEEVHDAGLTEFVEYNDDNEPDALRYPHMVSLCIKAIQEQQTIIDDLKSRIETLEG